MPRNDLQATNDDSLNGQRRGDGSEAFAANYSGAREPPRSRAGMSDLGALVTALKDAGVRGSVADALGPKLVGANLAVEDLGTISEKNIETITDDIAEQSALRRVVNASMKKLAEAENGRNVLVGGLHETEGEHLFSVHKHVSMSEAMPHNDQQATNDDSLNGQRRGDGSEAFAANYSGAHQERANHLSISAEARDSCVQAKTLGREALVNGVGCSSVKEETLADGNPAFVTLADGSNNGPALCAAKYEKKYRGNHRPGAHWSTGVSFAGEVHLCSWRSVKAC